MVVVYLIFLLMQVYELLGIVNFHIDFFYPFIKVQLASSRHVPSPRGSRLTSQDPLHLNASRAFLN